MCVPHRHRLAASALRISCSVGAAFRVSSAAVVMIIAGNAVSALRGLLLDEGPLNRVGRRGRSESFDRDDRAARGGGERSDARSYRLPIRDVPCTHRTAPSRNRISDRSARVRHVARTAAACASPRPFRGALH